MVYLNMTEKEMEAIEFMLLQNKICRTMKDINKVLEDKLKDDNKLSNKEITMKPKEKTVPPKKEYSKDKKDNKDDKYAKNKYYNYNKDAKI